MIYPPFHFYNLLKRKQIQNKSSISFICETFLFKFASSTHQFRNKDYILLHRIGRFYIL